MGAVAGDFMLQLHPQLLDALPAGMGGGHDGLHPGEIHVRLRRRRQLGEPGQVGVANLQLFRGGSIAETELEVLSFHNHLNVAGDNLYGLAEPNHFTPI